MAGLDFYKFDYENLQFIAIENTKEFIYTMLFVIHGIISSLNKWLLKDWRDWNRFNAMNYRVTEQAIRTRYCKFCTGRGRCNNFVAISNSLRAASTRWKATVQSGRLSMKREVMKLKSDSGLIGSSTMNSFPDQIFTI